MLYTPKCNDVPVYIEREVRTEFIVMLVRRYFHWRLVLLLSPRGKRELATCVLRLGSLRTRLPALRLIGKLPRRLSILASLSVVCCCRPPKLFLWSVCMRFVPMHNLVCSSLCMKFFNYLPSRPVQTVGIWENKRRSRVEGCQFVMTWSFGYPTTSDLVFPYGEVWRLVFNLRMYNSHDVLRISMR